MRDGKLLFYFGGENFLSYLTCVFNDPDEEHCLPRSGGPHVLLAIVSVERLDRLAGHLLPGMILKLDLEEP